MKVYVVYQENGFGGSEVAEVFSSKILAKIKRIKTKQKTH